MAFGWQPAIFLLHRIENEENRSSSTLVAQGRLAIHVYRSLRTVEFIRYTADHNYIAGSERESEGIVGKGVVVFSVTVPRIPNANNAIGSSKNFTGGAVQRFEVYIVSFRAIISAYFIHFCHRGNILISVNIPA